MMKIIAIGLLCNVLLRSGAAGDPMVKVKMCSEVFDNAMTESLSQITPSEEKDFIGDLEISNGNSRARAKSSKQSEMIPLTNVELKVLPKSKILSNDNYETRIQAKVKYGSKTFTWNGRKWTQSYYLFLDLDIMAVVSFTVKGDTIVYDLEDCEVSQRNRDTNLDNSWQQEFVSTFWSKWGRRWRVTNSNQRRRQQSENRELDQVETKLCAVADRIIAIQNENWKDYLIIDPSGEAKLDLNSIILNNDCLELTLNLLVKNAQVTSAQKHGALTRTGLSFLKDYMTNMMSAGDYLTELNKKMGEKKMELSPEGLQKLFHDVHEMDQTPLKCTVTKMSPPNTNADKETMTVMMKLEGYGSKEENPIFTVNFETTVKTKLVLNETKLKLKFLSSGDQVIHNSESSIGNSGDLDYKNLQILVKEMTSGKLLDAMNELDTTFNIPLWNVGSYVVVNPESVEILSGEK